MPPPDTNVIAFSARPVRRPQESEAPRVASDKPLRVLIIDDTPEDRMVVRLALESTGFLLSEVDTGERGLAAAAALRPDCILLDYHLPDLDGLEVLDALRRPDGTLPCAVVMLTGTSNGENAAKLMQAGALDYLSKQHMAEDNLCRAVQGAVERYRLIAESRRAEVRNAHLAAIVEASTDAIFSVDVDDRVLAWNPGAAALFGYTEAEAIGRTVEQLIVPEDQIAPRRKLYEDVRSGRVAIALETVRRHKDGSLVQVGINAAPMFDAVGGVIGLSMILRDISERKRHEEHLQLLTREINHRAKNMLSLVQSVARQTAATRPDDFLERFSLRIQAMGANQDLLIKSDWKAVALDELVCSQLAHFGDLRDTRVSISGSQLQITASVSQSLGMALHELATNAAKYGALSNDSGSIEIRWDVRSGSAAGAPRFTMSWVERGGPPVRKPTRRGFGSTVIGGMIKMGLGCDPEIDFAPTGLEWRIDCPADRVLEGHSARSLPRADSVAEAAVAPAVGRCRVLVVEDEPLIAMEIAETLSDAGFEVIGPAHSVAQALALIENTGCECAVLDTNLGRETAEPIAVALRSLKVPFISVSGYSREQQPLALRDAPLLAKPLQRDGLVAEIIRQVAG